VSPTSRRPRATAHRPQVFNAASPLPRGAGSSAVTRPPQDWAARERSTSDRGPRGKLACDGQAGVKPVPEWSRRSVESVPFSAAVASVGVGNGGWSTATSRWDGLLPPV